MVFLGFSGLTAYLFRTSVSVSESGQRRCHCCCLVRLRAYFGITQALQSGECLVRCIIVGLSDVIAVAWDQLDSYHNHSMLET